jgi:protein tyrosine phosphatase (PTP) superfamily phosphohydrolase (DUF442 family)
MRSLTRLIAPLAIVLSGTCLQPAAAAEPAAVSSAAKVEDIRAYKKVNDRVITAGQPTEEQLRAAATDGFKTVINLATINPRYSLKDEEGLSQSLGMKYRHIPVAFEKPTEDDFKAFEAAMQAAGDDKTVVHCAANFRASAFYSLYAMKHLGWSKAQAEEFRASIWSGSYYPVWNEFIAKIEGQAAK